VIPWVLSDSNYVRQPSQRLDSNKTVFVGALHGMMNAEASLWFDLTKARMKAIMQAITQWTRFEKSFENV
jgi:hypothetical protein